MVLTQHQATNFSSQYNSRILQCDQNAVEEYNQGCREQETSQLNGKCLETANVKSNYYLQDQLISIFEYKGDTVKVTVTFTVLAPYNAAPHNRYQPHPAEPMQHTTCSNTRLGLLKMGIMMPETC